MSTWSTPDSEGLQTLTESLHPRRRISGRRKRRAAAGPDISRIIWRKEELALLRELIPDRGDTRTWLTIERIAGVSRTQLLRELIDHLLIVGLVVVTDQKLRAADWAPIRVEFTDIGRVRELAGLPDLAARARNATTARSYQGRTIPVCRLAVHLHEMRDDVTVRRGALLESLDAWIESGRSGTRYDFALFATGRTKGIPRSDWDWLVTESALESASIVDHEPILRVAGRWTVYLKDDARMDIGRPPAPGGLAPATLAGARAMSPVARWVVIENRTVFDRASRIESDTAVLWTPGYSPEWWLRAVQRLVALAPAPLCIACDPDPAGIAIALRASAPWRERGLPWSTAGMAEAHLRTLSRIPLSDADLRILASIPMSGLDPTLTDLHRRLPALGKAEQEGFFDDVALRELLTGASK